MFRPSVAFYALTLVQIIAFEVAGWATLYTFGTGWLPVACAICLIAVSQVRSLLVYLFNLACLVGLVV